MAALTRPVRRAHSRARRSCAASCSIRFWLRACVLRHVPDKQSPPIVLAREELQLACRRPSKTCQVNKVYVLLCSAPRCCTRTARTATAPVSDLPHRHPRPRHPRQLRLSCCRRQPQHCLAGKSSALRALIDCHEMNGTMGRASSRCFDRAVALRPPLRDARDRARDVFSSNTSMTALAPCGRAPAGGNLAAGGLGRRQGRAVHNLPCAQESSTPTRCSSQRGLRRRRPCARPRLRESALEN